MGSYLQTGLFVTNNTLLPLTFIIDDVILISVISENTFLRPYNQTVPQTESDCSVLL